MRVAVAAVPAQASVWAAAFPEVAAEELERVAPAGVAQVRVDQAPWAAPEV